MKIVLKDLPKKLNIEEFKSKLNTRHTILEIDILKTNNAFRRVIFVSIPATEILHFISFYNNSYVEKNKIRCELHNKHEFVGIVDQKNFENIGDLDFVINNGNTIINTRKINIKSFVDAVIKNKLIEAGDCDAQNAEYYNTLFFDFNKVVESTKIEKEELIKENAAVRVAFLESELVYKTKMFLQKNGIFLDSLTGKRSKTAVIVKNFDISDVPKDAVVKTGPKNTIALIEFNSSNDALNFVKKNNAEFVPLSEKPERKKEAGSNKVIIKNLAFQATVEELKLLLETKVKIKNVRIPIKQNGQSRGFAFVECLDCKETTKLIDWFGNSTHFYGRRFVIEECE